MVPEIKIRVLNAASRSKTPSLLDFGRFTHNEALGRTKLYEPERSPGTIEQATCWVHARRPFFAMADLEENARRKAAGKKEVALSPIAIEIVRRIDALFAIERLINGQSADHRKAVRQPQSAPLVADLDVPRLTCL